MLEIKVLKQKIETVTNEDHTRGTVGAQVKIVFDEFWVNYEKTVVFERCNDTLSDPVNVLVNGMTTTIDIPPEILAECSRYQIGVFGKKDGKVLPTLYSERFNSLYATNTKGGKAPDTYTPSELDQLRELKQDKLIPGENVNIDANNKISVDLIGQKTTDGGEIFNDYDNNKALSKHSKASGENNIAGVKVFYIRAWNQRAKTYTLDSVEGLEIDDVVSVKWGGSYINFGKITKINTVNLTITTDNFAINDVGDPNTTLGVLFVVDKPTIGLHSFDDGQHVEGTNNVALLWGSHAEGYGNVSADRYAHTEGIGNMAYYAAHAEGYKTAATGKGSHSEGYGTHATGFYSHAEGNGTEATGNQSHAEGINTHATGDYSHAEGHSTTAEAMYAHAEGYNTHATNYYSHAEGSGTKASGTTSHAEGYNTNADGENSHAEGRNTTASGNGAHAEGYKTKATSNHAHAEGSGTKAEGENSHAEGGNTTASGTGAHAEGYNTNAEGNYSHAEGYGTKAEGNSSHAEGYNTNAAGNYSHAEGRSTTAIGNYSHAGGRYTIAGYGDQTVIGKFNNNKEDTLFEVGCGASEGQRENCFEAGKNQNGKFIRIGNTQITEDQLRELKQYKLTAGENITIDENNVISAKGGGTTDYTELSNKPKINGVELDGNKTTKDLGIEIPTKLSEFSNDVGYIDSSELENYYTKDEINAQIGDIETLLGGI